MRSTSSHPTTTCSLVLALVAELACAASSGDESSSIEPPHGESHGGSDVVDELTAAVSHWDDTCDAQAANRLCIRIETPTTAGRGCAPPRLGRVVVTPRVAAAEDARDALDDAIAMASDAGVPDAPRDAIALRSAIARARLAALDADLEAYLAIELPDATDTFAPVFERKRDAGAALVAALAEFKRVDDPAIVGAAALRTAWVHTHLADALVGMPVPPQFDGETREAYCRELDQVGVAPLRALARDVARWCRDAAQRPGWRVPELQACIALDDGEP